MAQESGCCLAEWFWPRVFQEAGFKVVARAAVMQALEEGQLPGSLTWLLAGLSSLPRGPPHTGYPSDMRGGLPQSEGLQREGRMEGEREGGRACERERKQSLGG